MHIGCCALLSSLYTKICLSHRGAKKAAAPKAFIASHPSEALYVVQGVVALPLIIIIISTLRDFSRERGLMHAPPLNSNRPHTKIG